MSWFFFFCCSDWADNLLCDTEAGWLTVKKGLRHLWKDDNFNWASGLNLLPKGTSLKLLIIYVEHCALCLCLTTDEISQ